MIKFIYLEFKTVIICHNLYYRYNAKYLQFDWLKQRAYF